MDSLGNSLTSSCALPQNTGTPSNLTNFTPLDIYCPTFETWVEIIFNSEASVSHNFSFRRAWSRLDRWSCDLDGYWLYTSPQRRNNGLWWFVNTHTSMLWWSMLHNWPGASFFWSGLLTFVRLLYSWTGFHRQGAPRSLWGSSRRHFDSGAHGYIFARWVFAIKWFTCRH